jgi:hypothetical protein
MYDLHCFFPLEDGFPTSFDYCVNCYGKICTDVEDEEVGDEYRGPRSCGFMDGIHESTSKGEVLKREFRYCSTKCSTIYSKRNEGEIAEWRENVRQYSG